MKTLVISDLHLSTKFDNRKFQFLKKLINDCDQLIVNGDLWTFYSCTFDEFINSDWNKLFKLMKEKNCIYLFGNHDRRDYCNEGMHLFSVKQGDYYELDSGDIKIHIEHGDKLVRFRSISHPTYIHIWRKLKMDERFRSPVESLVYSTLPFPKLSFMNNQMKRSLGNTETINIVGHSHTPEADASRSFFNTGFINHGLASYILIVEDKIELVWTRY